jgi:excisionase family DNA binding protein
MDRLLLKVHEAASAIAVGRSTMYRLISTGEIKSIRVGSAVRVPIDTLREWIARQGNDATGPKTA